MLGDQNVFNEKDVEYTLNVNASSIKGEQIDASNWSISSEPKETGNTVLLPGTQAKIVTYTVKFKKELLNNIKFAISANVNQANSPGTNLACLAATVTPAERSEVKSASVTGAWADTDDVSKYAAYNYRVSVTGKEQMVTLTWGANVELDPHFAKNHTDCNVDAKNRTATFTMLPGSEIVSFYWISGSPGPSEWDDLGVSVKASSLL